MNAIEWMAGLLILLGLWNYGRRNIWGPGFSIMGCMLWLGLGIMHGMYSLAVLNAVLLVTNSWNMALWYGSERPARRDGDDRNGIFKRKGI